jgi:hypothetical protein
MTVDCCSHGEDRNPRYEPREEEPGETNPDRKCARDRLPRYEIAITNREAGDEGEIDRVAYRPALHKANQQTQGNLKRVPWPNVAAVLPFRVGERLGRGGAFLGSPT